MSRANPVYPSDRTQEEILVLFDLREPGAAARLHRERAAWAECAGIETIDHNHYVLLIRPGGAYRVRLEESAS